MEWVYERLCNLKKLRQRVTPIGEIPSSEVIVKKTLKIAIPSILESFLLAIVAMVDTYMVSGLGDYAIAAVGLTNQPKFLWLSVFFAISMAISTLVARRRGAGLQQDANRVLQQAFIISLVLALVITIASFLLRHPTIRLMGSQPDTHKAAVDYYGIIMLGMVFNVITLVINAAQRGIGNTKIAMQTNVAANLVNVVFNYILINGKFGFPRLEVAGAAIATVLGTIVSAGMALWSVSNQDGYLCLWRGFKFRLEGDVVKSLTKLASPTMLEQIFVRIGFMLYFMLVARLGTIAYTAHNIGMQFISISFALADGLSVASIALVGRSLGGKRKDMALIYSSVCQKIGLCFSFLIGLIYIPFGRSLFSLFSKNSEVLSYGMEIMPIVAVIVFIQITMVIFVSCLRAAGDVKYVTAVSFFSIGIVRPLFSWMLCYPLGLGLVGAWFGMIIDQSIRLLFSFLRYRKGEWTDIHI